MTESQEIEEILIESYAHGMRDEVMEWAKKELEQNPKMRKVDAYALAFHEWCK
jgi:hypothetical protein